MPRKQSPKPDKPAQQDKPVSKPPQPPGKPPENVRAIDGCGPRDDMSLDVWIDFRTSVSGRRQFIARTAPASETSGLEQQAILLFVKYELYRKANFARGRDRYYEQYVDCLLRIQNA